jgi:hypothetical protein
MRVMSEDAPTLLSESLKDYLAETAKRVTKQTLAEK